MAIRMTGRLEDDRRVPGPEAAALPVRLRGDVGSRRPPHPRKEPLPSENTPAFVSQSQTDGAERRSPGMRSHRGVLHCVCVLPLSSHRHGAGSISSMVPLGNTAWLPHACCHWVTHFPVGESAFPPSAVSCLGAWDTRYLRAGLLGVSAGKNTHRHLGKRTALGSVL